MSKVTLRTIKARLATAFPDIEFTYGTAGRGHYRGHSVSWVGGPSTDVVRAAGGNPVWHYSRQDTDEERAISWAAYEIESAARVAAEPARRAAAKAAGIAKRADTLAVKRDRASKLRDAFPGVAFDLVDGSVEWTDGPDVAAVVALVGVSQYRCTRTESAQGAAQRLANIQADKDRTRLARRMAQSKARPKIIARGIQRKALYDAQMWLPLFCEPMRLAA